MKLKPCPFCEEEADIHVVDVTRSSDLRFKYEYQPGCETDECPGEWGGSSYCSADEAYKKWNTRATDPMLKEMADYIHDLLTKVARYGYDFQLETEFNDGKMIMQKYHEQVGER